MPVFMLVLLTKLTVFEPRRGKRLHMPVFNLCWSLYQLFCYWIETCRC